MRALSALILCLVPTLAEAGAWPRAPGETYVALSHEGGENGWTAFYGERGLPRDLTLGVDIGGHVAGGMLALRRGDPGTEMDGRAFAFLRIPLNLGTDAFPDWRVAAELGLGADVDWDAIRLETEPRARLGLSVGRGLATQWGDGWVNVDLRVEPGGDGMRVGLAGVAGLRPYGFELSDRTVRRAGLDYWRHVRLSEYDDWDDFLTRRAPRPESLYLWEDDGAVSAYDVDFPEDAHLVFGCETRGLPGAVLAALPGRTVRLPMRSPHIRSLNLANAVTAAAYLALRGRL
jgi:tRNA (cytidine/uridine-2'-O-)-methyltransferase